MNFHSVLFFSMEIKININIHLNNHKKNFLCLGKISTLPFYRVFIVAGSCKSNLILS